MEKRTGNIMVAEQIKYVSVSIKEIIENDYRLEASVYNFNSRLAKETLKKCKYPIVTLFGANGFIDKAFYGGRAKRNYVPKNTIGAFGFLGSSEMLELVPNPIKFLTSKSQKIEQFKVQKDLILMSRSGTIGNLTLVNDTLTNFLISEHAIRLKLAKYSGFVYAYLSSEIGQELIQSNIYGAVISQIEPEHLHNIEIPNPPDEIKQKIHDLIINSFELRDQYNELLKKAENILYEELKLIPIENIKPKYFDETVELKNYSVSLTDLDLRFDASYHLPILKEVTKLLKSNAESFLSLSNLSKTIKKAGIFKRTYVESKEDGITFLGSNDILQLNPKSEKYLSKEVHKKLIEKELRIKENMILISCRGTIGNVVLAPKYFENFALSDNAIKIELQSNELVGYVFLFLNSDYGKALIKRETTGSVIDLIDPHHLTDIQIPLLHNKDKQKEINDLVLKANNIRTIAFEKEQEGIRLVNELVINTNSTTQD